ncbi:MAG: hypothetical protein IKE08_06425, partial [Clostridia bacterium]|nr:hypothetical protein [Clostridia bacterium]
DHCPPQEGFAMLPETEPEQIFPWQEKRPWLSGNSEPTMPDQDEDTLDEITRSALEEMRIA